MTSVAEIFIFGFANSLHCAGMCGPLCVGVLGTRTSLTAYHVARVASYASIGALAGAVGEAVVGKDASLPSAWLSIGLGAALLIGALGWVRLPTHFGGGRLVRWMRTLMALRPMTRGFGLGLLTPLLPCGVLYIAVATALGSGGTWSGATLLAAFALGSLPGLLLVSANAAWFGSKVSPRQRARIFRGMLIVASAVLVVRGILDLNGGSCCH